MNPPLAAIYRRVSTDRQDDSLALQEQRVLAYAQFKNFRTTDHETFSDPDTSGRTPMLERTGGRALMNRLGFGDVKHVIVAKLDRLGRNVRDALGILEKFKELGVTLHIVDLGGENITTQGHMGKFILTLLLTVAEWEAEEIRDRVTKQMRDRFDKLQLTGNVPFGYDAEYTFADGHRELSPRALRFKTARVRDAQRDAAGQRAYQEVGPEPAAQALLDAHGGVTGNRLLDNPGEQAWIRRMAEWQRQKIPMKTIAKLLNAQGSRTKLGRPWQVGSVNGVLTSRHTARLLQAVPVAQAA